ncbi:SOUL family heme-binding protein [Caulobacter henricii]|uniref:SOUL family heme-binding protein n=1 Tax=Caulobacter henricii TaxID=69395 RepID=UPI000A05FF3B|nr:heme-binding protein [Caulobacter henricii]
MAVEEPAYRSVLRVGAFEIRDYPTLIVAEVSVSGDQKEAAGSGFRLLAGYIFGGNTRRQSIAMTAPVTQVQSAGKWIVRFTMPSAYSMATLPEPNDPNVHLRAVPATRFAVLKFSGLAGKEDVTAKAARLEGLVSTHNLSATGPVSLAQYDPPWTLWFMRRNELMLPVAP